jgi:hypothetical protein
MEQISVRLPASGIKISWTYCAGIRAHPREVSVQEFAGNVSMQEVAKLTPFRISALY